MCWDVGGTWKILLNKEYYVIYSVGVLKWHGTVVVVAEDPEMFDKNVCVSLCSHTLLNLKETNIPKCLPLYISML